MTTKEELKLQQEDWMVKKWRPAMGWTYMGICILDMAIFPILWSLLQAAQGGQVTSQWNPLTLQGAGLFHIAMGAVLGIAAWSRGQEKMNGATGGFQQMSYGGYNQRQDPYISAAYGSSYSNSYPQQAMYQPPGQVVMINGRPAPIQPPHQEI